MRRFIDQIFSEYLGISREELKLVSSIVYSSDSFKELKTWNVDWLLKPDLSSILSSVEVKVYKLKEVVESISMGIQYRDLDKIDEKLLIKGKELNVMEIYKAAKDNVNCSKQDYRLHQGDVIFRIKGKIGPAAHVKYISEGLYHYHDTAMTATCFFTKCNFPNNIIEDDIDFY